MGDFNNANDNYYVFIDILNNTATAIIFSPIAIKLAERLEVSADLFFNSGCISASCAFLTF